MFCGPPVTPCGWSCSLLTLLYGLPLLLTTSTRTPRPTASPHSCTCLVTAVGPLSVSVSVPLYVVDVGDPLGWKVTGNVKPTFAEYLLGGLAAAGTANGAPLVTWLSMISSACPVLVTFRLVVLPPSPAAVGSTTVGPKTIRSVDVPIVGSRPMPDNVTLRSGVVGSVLASEKVPDRAPAADGLNTSVRSSSLCAPMTVGVAGGPCSVKSGAVAAVNELTVTGQSL